MRVVSGSRKSFVFLPAAICCQVLYWNVQPDGKTPLLPDATPFRVWNNVFVKNAMNAAPVAPWQQHSTSIITWKGYTASEFMRNVVYVDLAGIWPQYKGGPLLMTEACSKQFHVSPNASCGDRPLDNFVPAAIDYNVCKFCFCISFTFRRT